MTTTRQIVLASQPQAAPLASDFTMAEAELPPLADGELLVRVHVLSLDPYLLSRIRGRHMSGDAPDIGETVPSEGVGEVLESRADGFVPGDFVLGVVGWQEHAVLDGKVARKIDASIRPLSLHLGVCGMPGLTAYASAHHLAKATDGDRVLVSSAAGPVGGTVGQLARIMGADKVVGIAGGPEKCALVKSDYGFDDCVDYKADGWQDRVAAALPDGISYYHDNVGGELLETALANLSLYGRVVLCGLASQYSLDHRPAGPNPGIYIGKRAQLLGLVVYDFMHEIDDYAAKAAAWIADGKLSYVEDRADGLDAAPALFEKLGQGSNIGKTVVQLVPEERA
ncbi:NADP-dependent oxidoreductase [Aurantiacibacter gangjinensis]|uniref:Uncharacterized protein n=1 Tax=Aurantiacibacter gangjinensis TaxID=502682 RepID=A0A0G9MRV2_9SPHN|nr:NADP-dependent oxidoreductase [Aurantiacibacter gangjinensis]APE28128.1 Putative oxidoreductase YncB [Aurantiacibacter gangjinensis]KLE32048.1 hypothetical protein AAW01_11525 [Aurantiacibacter gangjinensis]